MLDFSVIPMTLPETVYDATIPDQHPLFYLDRDASLVNVELVLHHDEDDEREQIVIFHYADESKNVAFRHLPEWAAQHFLACIMKFHAEYEINHYDIESPQECHTEVARCGYMGFESLEDGESLDVVPDKNYFYNPEIDEALTQQMFLLRMRAEAGMG